MKSSHYVRKSQISKFTSRLQCIFHMGAYLCMGAYKCDVVVVIKMGAYIHGVLFFCVGAYYPVIYLIPQSNLYLLLLFLTAPPSLPSICNTGCYCGNPPTYDECHTPFVIINGLQNGLVIPFSMTVNYTGNGPFEVQWLRNGVEIFCGGHSRYSCKNHTAHVGTTVIVSVQY